MNKTFGIDFGSAYTRIAYTDENGVPSVIRNAEGDFETPSAVIFESPTAVTVGSAAKENAIISPEKAVTFIKRCIGRPGFILNVDGVDMKPEEISSCILKKAVKDAEDSLRTEGILADGESVRDVVITCPPYFGADEQASLRDACLLAGLNVKAMISDVFAVLLSYGLNLGENETVLVYDLGGGTFDITLVNVADGAFHVVCAGGDLNLGGKDWDDRVLMYLTEQYQTETGANGSVLEDPETLQELSLAAERAKKLLSEKEKVSFAVNCAGKRVRSELTREKFDELTEDLLTRTIDLTKEMFVEAGKKGFSQKDVSRIILAGGGSLMPQIEKRLRLEFGIGVDKRTPGQCAAKGAAIYADMINDGC